MSNFDDLYQGFVIMISFCIVGIILALFGGYILDMVFKYFDAAGVLDVPPNWQTMGSSYVVMNIWYLWCGLFPVIGIAAFIKTLIRREGRDNYIAM